MEVQVLTKKENPLLKRTEVTFKAVHKAEATPTRDALRSELAKQLKATKDHVIVDGARSTFGRFETVGYAKVYKSKEQALAVERSHILVRNKLKEAEVKEKKEGEKAEKPPKAEKPAADKKEEAKPEHKAEPKAEHKEEKVPAREEKKPAAEKKEEKHEERKAGEKHEEKKEAKPAAEKGEAKKAEPKKKEGK